MRKNRLAAPLLSCLLLLAALPVLALEYTGRVVGVHDGDTLTLLTPEKRQIRVRLGEIDTPERRQPSGTRARQALSELAFGKAIRVVEPEEDRYGRGVADACCQRARLIFSPERASVPGRTGRRGGNSLPTGVSKE